MQRKSIMFCKLKDLINVEVLNHKSITNLQRCFGKWTCKHGQRAMNFTVIVYVGWYIISQCSKVHTLVQVHDIANMLQKYNDIKFVKFYRLQHRLSYFELQLPKYCFGKRLLKGLIYSVIIIIVPQFLRTVKVKCWFILNCPVFVM